MCALALGREVSLYTNLTVIGACCFNELREGKNQCIEIEEQILNLPEVLQQTLFIYVHCLKVFHSCFYFFNVVIVFLGLKELVKNKYSTYIQQIVQGKQHLFGRLMQKLPQYFYPLFRMVFDSTCQPAHIQPNAFLIFCLIHGTNVINHFSVILQPIIKLHSTWHFLKPFFNNSLL